MLPIRHKTIFKNRWWALAWAGGIVWSATQFVGSQPNKAASGNTADANTPTSDDGAPLSNDDVAAAKKALAVLGAGS
jgi:hypothetical protein